MSQNFSFTPTHSNHLILLVQENKSVRLMYKELLEIWNYRVITSGDGEDAIYQARNYLPDLILMDVLLPKIDGITATRRIREFERLREISILFLSVYTDWEVRDAAISSGGNDYLVKPIDFKDLENILKSHIKKLSEAPENFVH